MATVKELVSSWDKSGRPRSAEGVAQVLRDAGLDEQQIKQVFDSQGIQYNIPTGIPDEMDDPAPEPEPAQEDMPIPVGFTLKSKTGAEIVWKGAQWTNKGKIVPKKYKEQLNKQAQKVLRQQMAQKQKDDEEAQRTKDAEYEFEDEPTQQSQVGDKVQNMGKLQGLAQQIQTSKHKDRIMQLLLSNDPMAQRAISILLSGKAEEVLASLKAKK